MHMLSKKDLSSDELETLRRSRNPTTVVTANGEVQTNEEAQVYVHDLNLFGTVQLLEETPAVLSLGKLCEDHGYTYEWVTGQKPRLTKEEKTILCKTDNFVPRSKNSNDRLRDLPDGRRSSQIISRMQKCLYQHTFYMTQIRNVQRKVASRRHNISTHFPKDRNCAKYACEPR